MSARPSPREGPRVAIVTNVLAHYRVPCFERLAELLPGRLTIFLLTETMAHRDYVLADAASPGLPLVPLEVQRRWRRPPDDDAHLNDVRPILAGDFDVVILGGWAEPTFLLLWLRCLPRRTRVLFWVESTLHDRRRSLPREALKRLLLRAAAGCIVPGQRAGEYCRRLGMAESRIFVAPNAADRAFFRRHAEERLPHRAKLKAAMGLGEDAGCGLTVLFVGRLVESIKAVESLLQAVAALAARGVDTSLLVAGDGPDHGRYQQLASELGSLDVRFLGTLPHQELCDVYAVADVLVLPSFSETWGFVLNEGMEFGLPLVVSEAVGAGSDLVHPDENGFVVPAGDAEALAAALAKLAADEALRQRMGRASRRRIEDFSPETWARGVIAAVEAVTATR